MLPWGFSLFNFYNSQIINSAIKAGCRSAAIVMYIQMHEVFPEYPVKSAILCYEHPYPRQAQDLIYGTMLKE
jgi:hypothetical protein